MKVEIDKQKVVGVQLAAGEALSDKGFAIPEVLFGLSELIGRILMDKTGGTIVEKLEMLKDLTAHAERTIRIGWIANGGNNGG